MPYDAPELGESLFSPWSNRIKKNVPYISFKKFWSSWGFRYFWDLHLYLSMTLSWQVSRDQAQFALEIRHQKFAQENLLPWQPETDVNLLPWKLKRLLWRMRLTKVNGLETHHLNFNIFTVNHTCNSANLSR